MHKKLATSLTFFCAKPIFLQRTIEAVFIFVSIPVILFRDAAFYNTDGLLILQGRSSTQNHNSTIR